MNYFNLSIQHTYGPVISLRELLKFVQNELWRIGGLEYLANLIIFAKHFCQFYGVKFHIIPEMTSHRLSVVKFKIKISSYFLNKALS